MPAAPASFVFGRSPFSLLDIETTGFSARMHEITEISAIRVDERFQIVAQVNHLVKICSRVPWEITRLTGLTDSMLSRHGIPLHEALASAHRLISGHRVYAHNARFDQSFLNAAVEQTAAGCSFTLDCSIPVFKKLLPGRPKYGLSHVAEALGVSADGAHRGLKDCTILLSCLQRAHA